MVVKLNGAPCEDWPLGIVSFSLYVPVMKRGVMPFGASGFEEGNPGDR